MIDGLMGQLSLKTFLGALFIAIFAVALFVLQRLFIGGDRKIIQNKALLKTLLEDLGLEVPLELQNSNRDSSVKSLKKI